MHAYKLYRRRIVIPAYLVEGQRIIRLHNGWAAVQVIIDFKHFKVNLIKDLANYINTILKNLKFFL